MSSCPGGIAVLGLNERIAVNPGGEKPINVPAYRDGVFLNKTSGLDIVL